MKNVRKALALLISCLLILSCFHIITFAQGQITVKIRIEGAGKNLLFKTVTVDEDATILEVLKLVDESSSAITVVTETFPNGTYIQKINDEEYGYLSGTKGTDGWFFTVNYVDPEPGMTIDQYKLKDGDNVVIYYGDPIGVGFDYPEVDLSNFKTGTVKFVSYVKTEDAFGDPIYKARPVSNAMVTWQCGFKTIKLPTDSNGEIIVPQEYRTGSIYTVQIEKTAAGGLPLVLRFEPHYVINVQEESGGIQFEMSDTLSKLMEILQDIVNLILLILEEANIPNLLESFLVK